MNVVLTFFQNVWKVILCQHLFASCAASEWPKYVNAGKVNAHRLMAYSSLVKFDWPCKELGRAQECPFFSGSKTFGSISYNFIRHIILHLKLWLRSEECKKDVSFRSPLNNHIEITQDDEYPSKFSNFSMIGEEVNITYTVTSARSDHIGWFINTSRELIAHMWRRVSVIWIPLLFCVSHVLRWKGYVTGWLQPLALKWNILLSLRGRTRYCTWRMSPPQM